MTVTDVRRRMPQHEFQMWVEYVKKNGPLNSMLRVESSIARAVTPFLRNVKPRDLMIWPRPEEQEATPDALLMMFKNLSAASKRKH